MDAKPLPELEAFATFDPKVRPVQPCIVAHYIVRQQRPSDDLQPDAVNRYHALSMFIKSSRVVEGETEEDLLKGVKSFMIGL